MRLFAGIAWSAINSNPIDAASCACRAATRTDAGRL